MNGLPASATEAPLLARIRIVLSRTSHPGNIGAAARAMRNMGLSRLVLVRPRAFPDPEATARAAGADDLLAGVRVCDDLDAALTGVRFVAALSARHRSIGPAPRALRDGMEELLAQAADGEIALLFGNETAGLSNDEVQRCQRTLYIPSDPDFSSLNLAAAVQLVAYELRMAVFAGAPPVQTRTVPFSSPLAPHEDVERFYAHLERVMRVTGFLDPAQPRRLLPKLRRLFGRAALERDEINILRGILDAVERRLPLAGGE